jgi:hypothetical protein
MKIPGVNPFIAWYMKQHNIHDGYAATEGYEILHWYFGPRMEAYFRELEQRTRQGIRTITRNDIAETCGAIERRWLEQDIRVPETERFVGKPLDAIAAACAAVKGAPARLP